ncbi:MAG: MarR family transcriptional regulator [Bacteroidota bacterium]
MKIEEEIQQSRFSNAKMKALINIIYTAYRINDSISDVLKDFDLTQPQFNILRILRGRNGQAATCGDIKNVMIDKNPDVTRICDKLILKELISRQFNSCNRRQVLLSITDKGLELLTSIDPIMDEQMASFGQLDDQALEKLSDYLDQIRK